MYPRRGDLTITDHCQVAACVTLKESIDTVFDRRTMSQSGMWVVSRNALNEGVAGLMFHGKKVSDK
jgi:hypothetical protein